MLKITFTGFGRLNACQSWFVNKHNKPPAKSGKGCFFTLCLSQSTHHRCSS
jgi:hypothetical protein